ncbi:MAG: HU family DNA-binding protein [Clostridia bacterium]|nr:HU family DNA-binding protein [Clostridia bacterium]
MNKAELIDSIASKTGYSKKVSSEILNAFSSTVTDALVKGEKVQLVGFGSFETKTRAARKGLNPQTKEEIRIPACKAPTFKAGKTLKNIVNS